MNAQHQFVAVIATLLRPLLVNARERPRHPNEDRSSPPRFSTPSCTDADTITLFLAHEHSPGDLRLVYQKGLRFKETEYGILSRRTVRKYLAEVTSPRTERVASYHDDIVSPHTGTFPDKFIYREGLTTSIQKLWVEDDLPVAMLFINFRSAPPLTVLYGPEAINLRLRIYDAIWKRLRTYQKSHASRTIDALTHKADALGMGLYFGATDLEKMTRQDRDNVVARLIDSVITAYLPQRTYWWTLHSLGPGARVLIKTRHFGELGALAPQRILTSDHSYIESCSATSDRAIRLVACDSLLSSERFTFLTGTRLLLTHGPATESLLVVPITSGDEIFAIATIGIYPQIDGARNISPNALTTALRSLWLNGRRVSQFWRQSVGERSARFRKTILTQLASSLIPGMTADSQANALREILRAELHADHCTLWGSGPDGFYPISSSDATSPPRAENGWSRIVADSNTPLLFQRDDFSAVVKVVSWDFEDSCWKPLRYPDVVGPQYPEIRPGQWLTSLALPLTSESGSQRRPGVAWIQFKTVMNANHLDIEWACACATEVALLMESAKSHRELIRDAERRKIVSILRALRHEAVGRVPDILDRAIQAAETPEEFWSMREKIRDVACLLETMLAFYGAFEARPPMQGKPCDAVDETRRAINLAELLRPRSPAIDFTEDHTQEPLVVRIGRESLWAILLNLLINSKKYRRVQAPADEAIRVTVRAHDQRVQICIDDAGVGMTPDQIARAGHQEFDPDDTRGDQGAGIGLLLSGRILSNAGDWSFQSPNARGGVTVTITLLKGDAT